MKKLFIIFTILFVLSGCGENKDSKTLSCSTTDKANGITTTTKYDFKYKNDEVDHVTITYDYVRDNANEDMDGVNADTDGLDEDNENVDDNVVNSDEVVDGVVGDTIDETVDTVTDTILDIAGIKNDNADEISNYNNIEGFSYEVATDTDDHYKVVYEIDMNKISDDDLEAFDIDRNLATSRGNYEDTGYTCK